MTETPGLEALAGVRLASELMPGVSYRLERLIGAGGLGVVFFGLRDAPDSVAPVVIKVLRPAVVRDKTGLATKLVKKEVVALGRLNESVPPTPFVVRFVDTGTLTSPELSQGLPWIALEYVHGGLEGTTLEERVKFSVRQTGSAFEPERVAHALRCLAKGIEAIHAVGVLHRDLAPSNVLCCGFGDAEVFKISDFGLARLDQLETFGPVMLGTPGYSAPEQSFPDRQGAGPYSDVFSLATIAYFMLAGEDYFPAKNAVQALMLVNDPSRRSLFQAKFTSPDLRADAERCRDIDRVLERATSVDPARRYATPRELVQALAPSLGAPRSLRAERRLAESVRNPQSPAEVRGWSFAVRGAGDGPELVGSAAWDSDGRCLLVRGERLSFWDGEGFRPGPAGMPGLVPRSVERIAAGTWLVGCDQATLAIFSSEGLQELVKGPRSDRAFQHVGANAEDLLVAVAECPDGLEFWARSGRQWLPALPLGGFRHAVALRRFGPNDWLLAGSDERGQGRVSRVRPLERQVEPIETLEHEPFVACATQSERGIAVAAGQGGTLLKLGFSSTWSHLGAPAAVSACAVDALGRVWVAGLGRIWAETSIGEGKFRCVWEDPNARAPIVSLLADVGRVLALGADGLVIEGRAPWQNDDRPSP